MKITQIIIENFKSISNRIIIDTNKPIVCFVGENNTGKTTIFRAIDFLRNGVAKDKTIDDYKNVNRKNDDVFVEIIIQGNLTDIINEFAEKKYLDYIEKDTNGNESIRLRRSSEKITISQNKKPIDLDEKKICTFNPTTQQFENPTGFDKAIGSLFDNIFVWSDMLADDIVDFSSTKILGKLIKEVSGQFEQSQDWLDFKTAHQTAFVTGENSLSNQSKNLVNQLQNSLANFYGNASINLDFTVPEPASFVKLGNIKIDDGIETLLNEKGSGMQRAFALSVIKVYADYLSTSQTNTNLNKPLFFFIDEPEISLHPKAQYMLINALNNISQQQQVFITTHSAYLLSMFKNTDTTILITSQDNGINSVNPIATMNTFDFSPTLAEIGYFAFNIASNDFHNELYGYIEEKIKRSNRENNIKKDSDYYEFDIWVSENCGIKINKPRIKLTYKGGEKDETTTLTTYIRHAIHHPENKKSCEFKECELRQSIQEMLNILKHPNFVAIK